MSTPITIKGVRFETVNLSRNEDGRTTITSTYALISSLDKVLARQDVGGYNGMKVQPSATTEKAFADAIALYRADVCSVLGLDPS